MAQQAWAQNAIITDDDGSFVHWKPRCPKCGHVPPNRLMSGTANKGIRAFYSATCDRCGSDIDVVISRG